VALVICPECGDENIVYKPVPCGSCGIRLDLSTQERASPEPEPEPETHAARACTPDEPRVHPRVEPFDEVVAEAHSSPQRVPGLIDGDEQFCERCQEPAEPGRRLCGFCQSSLEPQRTLTLVFAGERVEVAGELKLGRDPSFSPQADRLDQFGDVSRIHAIVRGPDDPTVQDIKSTFGTWVNTVQLPPWGAAQLCNGDRVRLGRSCVFYVELGP
jgi:hypothetical protein